MAKQVLFITILITLCVPTVGTGAFKEKNLNFDDISSSKTEYYYDPVMLLAFLFFLQNNSFQNNWIHLIMFVKYFRVTIHTE